ncbi:helix-turn-helix domain-containing protein [Spirosoma sordidisoli]|uniref:XRE family transcriptional regulator n=1 Tax=Spirosoma sordidisoli TaxID=2502893 RepID=A0A4Q2UPB6_9BACT|nr:helix-turn-helix transcriptional regulator [Spirosoma sordidisoli]RYC70722.1 XRE family transcriptional regulator [Spirosoma sordidisoli]
MIDKSEVTTRHEPTPETLETGRRLYEIRRAKGLTQLALGKLFKLANGQGTISGYERGYLTLGKHGRQQYILILGANPDYIDRGTLPMFSPISKTQPTAEQVLASLERHKGGNLRFISSRDIGQWLKSPHRIGIPYDLIPTDCYSFPVTTHDFGADMPLGSQLICVRTEPGKLQIGRLYVAQTAEELHIGRYTMADNGVVLSSTYGNPVVVKPDTVVQWYLAERIDKPIV